jgi:phosphoglycerate dehydrogenase-like enzyme
MSRSYANDWKIYSEGFEYSVSLDLYYYQGKVYDELSAKHNGIIGLGSILKEIAKLCSQQQKHTYKQK